MFVSGPVVHRRKVEGVIKTFRPIGFHDDVLTGDKMYGILLGVALD